MDVGTSVSLLITLVVAFTGYLVTYLNNLRLARRNDRLDRINDQLSNFYGPLLALNSAGRSAWLAFRTLYRPGTGSFWYSEPPPSENEAKAWRIWMTSVLMPLNRRMTEVIVSRADLLDESEIPQCLLQVCAHVASYEAVIAQWEQGDYSMHKGINRFPQEEFEEYVSNRFRSLKREQTRLLGSVQSKRY